MKNTYINLRFIVLICIVGVIFGLTSVFIKQILGVEDTTLLSSTLSGAIIGAGILIAIILINKGVLYRQSNQSKKKKQ